MGAPNSFGLVHVVSDALIAIVLLDTGCSYHLRSETLGRGFLDGYSGLLLFSSLLAGLLVSFRVILSLGTKPGTVFVRPAVAMS